MTLFDIIIIITAVATTIASIFLLIWNIKLRQHLQATEQQMREANEDVLVFRSKEAGLKEEINKLQDYCTNLTEEYNQNEKELAVLRYRNQDLVTQLHDWGSFKEQAINAANAAVFEVGSQLSQNLLTQNAEQMMRSKEESTREFSKQAEQLHTQFGRLTEVVAILKEQVTSSNDIVMQVKNSLLTPNAVGALGEMILENILKSSGLMCKRDYLLQPSFDKEDGYRLRPDAIVFLPNDNMMVIDSKSSSYFAELNKYREKNEEKKFALKIKDLMNVQLKSLIDKDYRRYVEESFSLEDKKLQLSLTIMFLPTDAAFEILQQADGEFLNKAWQNNVIPLGPSGLLNILLHAKYMVNLDMQKNNYDKIVYEIKKLLDNIFNVNENAIKIGASLKNSLTSYEKFMGLFNKQILTRASNLGKLGIISDKSHKFKDLSLVVSDEEEKKEEEVIS